MIASRNGRQIGRQIAARPPKSPKRLSRIVLAGRSAPPPSPRSGSSTLARLDLASDQGLTHITVQGHRHASGTRNSPTASAPASTFITQETRRIHMIYNQRTPSETALEEFAREDE